MSGTPGANLSKVDNIPAMSDDDGAEAQGHLNKLVEAHGILNDPEKMARVHGLVGRHVAAVKGIKSTEDLKNIYDEKYGSGVKGSNKSGSKQENDLNSDHATMQKGDGNDGNKGAAPYGASGHSKSSMKQKDPLHFSKPGNSGSGDDGN